ncbi:MAG: hypothetical protein HN742_12280 [Lentisphaerae bacterium]|jgi:hypothetical protein|nr:hypothetical protein [Lentisphaerota bacterium]MBT4823173.1 hypothetical protein [Lentisphaerota bacterium]MBT5607229.1 hypothetical protein [Lentisphaerota bacterium]MBT7054254.1 hypothetical protein [Lentisphaerota bacterium]MBT7842645.1 hypothetical protein [Lentisphaerota bacterium]
MFDIKVNLFPVTVDGRSFPGVWRRMREGLWSFWHRRDLVRYSISAMVRIQIDDAFLLVRNRKFSKFQPVGGVLKRLRDSAGRLRDMGLREDNMFAPDELNRDDLRVQVPATSVIPFLNWYATGKGREASPWREFHEELVAPGHLSAAAFPHIQVQHVRQHNTGIQPARHANNGARFECRIAEIFELIPTGAQRRELRKLRNRGGGELLWATAEEIQTLGVVPKKREEAIIAETAQWIV